jgi:hypothetical protein
MSMIWWFSTSATVVTKLVWPYSPDLRKEVSSSPMALVLFSRLRSAARRAAP